MVGQLEAREAAGIIVDLIKARKLAGECFAYLLARSSGSCCWQLLGSRIAATV